MTGLRYLTVLAAAAGLAAASAALDDQSPNPDRHHVRDFALLQKRETCGPGIGNCPAGQCCSQYNWCGTTDQHCGGGCQSQYGTCGSGGNGGNTGGNTGGNFNGIPRPQFGSVPYGVTLTSCSTPGTIAITFDDGPYIYTNQLLDLLASTGVKSTFFINGNNYADTSQAPYPDILRRMVADGHQIASHTFSHADLDTLDTAGRQSQMAQLENLFKGIFGSVPTYMRPPYGNCGGGCLADLAAMGYHVITWNIDTDDYDHDDPNGIQVSVGIFDSAVSGNAGSNAYISLEHDVHEWTVNTLAAHIINTAHSRGYRTVTVGECLGDPSGNWYRDGTTGNAVGGGNSGGNTGGNTGGGLTASTDGSCASNSGGRFTCQGSSFGNCCSQYGWCGSTNDYCGGGCQGGFGSCGSSGGNTGGNTGGGLSASPDGTCASNSGNKYTCLGSSFGNCCSQWGWCGSTADYCGGGCQGGFGTC